MTIDGPENAASQARRPKEVGLVQAMVQAMLAADICISTQTLSLFGRAISAHQAVDCTFKLLQGCQPAFTITCAPPLRIVCSGRLGCASGRLFSAVALPIAPQHRLQR